MRPEAGDPRLDGVADGGRSEDVAARDDVAEVRVARDLEPHPAGAADAVDDRQQRDRSRRRVARHDALAEVAAAQHVRRSAIAPLGRERLMRGDHDGGRGGARAGEELPARRHLVQDNTPIGGTDRS